MRRAEPGGHLGVERLGLLGGEHALVDEPCGVQLADGRMALDPLDHDRLRVRGLVLLVVAEAPVADEVDDDVVAEPPPVREREPDGGDRRLRVVAVHVDDRDVEALREVGRVARRATLRGVGREPDLVVGDQVQRPAGRVALERFEVERLRDDALAGEGRVAVEQDRHRDGRVVEGGAGRAVGLLRTGAPLDDRVDGLEVARVRDERDADRPRRGVPRAVRAEVVLHVARAALRVGDDGLDHPLALELADDLLVRHPDRVREDVEPAAVGHPDHDLARAVRGRELDRRVEHRDHHVEALDRELLLAEERPAEVPLHPLDLAEPRVERALLCGVERSAVPPRLDRLPEPDALLVAGDVLDLVGHRPAVRLLEARQSLAKRLALDADAQHRGRDARRELVRQLRLEVERVERRVAGRLGPERVEPRGQMAVHAVGLHERHRGGDAAEQHEVARRLGRGRFCCGRVACGLRRLWRGCRRGAGRVAVRVPVAPGRFRRALEQPCDARECGERVDAVCLEERPPLRRDGLGILEVLVEEQTRVAGIQPIDVAHDHSHLL